METNNQLNNPKMPKWVTPKVLWSVIGVLLLIVVVSCVAWYQVIKHTPPINNSGCPAGQVPIGVGSGPNGAKVICATQSLTQSADATSTWKTYSDTSGTFKYEFKYPSEWPVPIISQEEGDKVISLGQISKGGCEGTDCYLTFFSVATATPQSASGLGGSETPEQLLASMKASQVQTLLSDTMRSDGSRMIVGETGGNDTVGEGTNISVDLFYSIGQSKLRAKFDQQGDNPTQIEAIASTFKFTN